MKFKIGDKVRLVSDVDGVPAGTTGTIVATRETHFGRVGYDYGIDMNQRPRGMGHTINGILSTETGWNVQETAIELAKEETRMKIGQYEVTEVSRDSARVGCQVVTRAEAEALVREMDKVPEFQLRIVSGPRDRYNNKKGDVWLDTRDDGSICVRIGNKDGYGNSVLRIGKNGLTPHTAVVNNGVFPVDPTTGAIIVNPADNKY